MMTPDFRVAEDYMMESVGRFWAGIFFQKFQWNFKNQHIPSRHMQDTRQRAQNV